jgi:hypothetical protein
MYILPEIFFSEFEKEYIYITHSKYYLYLTCQIGFVYLFLRYACLQYYIAIKKFVKFVVGLSIGN